MEKQRVKIEIEMDCEVEEYGDDYIINIPRPFAFLINREVDIYEQDGTD